MTDDSDDEPLDGYDASSDDAFGRGFDGGSEDDADDVLDRARILLETAESFPLERRRLPDDPELAGEGMAVVGSFLGERLIARSVAPGDWTPDADGGLLKAPRQLVYVGEVRPDGTLYAQLGAVVPPEAIPREPWQPEPEGAGLLLLGVVVRLAQDRRADRAPAEEAVDHFATILGRGGVPVVDKLLGGL